MGAETQRVGDIFVRFGLLDGDRLQRVLARQRELRSQGRPARIGEVAVELGLLKPEQVKRVLAHEGTAILACPQCDRRYTIPQFQANRRYKCGDCKIYLDFPKDNKIASTATAPPQVEAGPPPTPSSKEQTYGPYKLIRLIGKGGMGSVYLAEHGETKKQIALKILAEQFSKIPDVVKRFKREATAGGKLEHPNIVQIYDIDQQGTSFYIVSEFVDGLGLEKLMLKEKRLAPERAAKIMRGVFAGLQHAHECGIVHRDIKPANILLTSSEEAKLIDFGIAKDAESQTVLTLAGSVLGSPSYMSPEQAQGNEVGPSTDLYAAGVVFFVLLTGKKPYEGRNLVETLTMHVREPVPSLRAIAPEVPESFEKIVHRLMAKEPAKRYAKAKDAIVAIDKAMKGGAVSAVQPAAPKKKPGLPKWILAAAGAGLLLAAAAAWWFGFR